MKRYKDTPYFITEDGKVYRDNRELKPYFTKDSYLRYSLNFDGKNKHLLSHRLVGETYIPNPENKPEINHKDSNKHNNNISNLEWVTHKENMSHAKGSGRYKSVDGKNNPNSKLTEKQVEYIRENYIPYHKEYGRSNLSKTFNVTPKTIHDITHNKSWINKT